MESTCPGCGAPQIGDAPAGAWTCAHCGRTNTGGAGPVVPPELPVGGAVVLERDLPCVRCGYSLQGLASHGACPECGASIERSLRGNLLEFADPAYLRTLRRGALVVIVGVIGSMLASVAVIGLTIAAAASAANPQAGALRGRWLEITPPFVELCGSFVVLLGWWLLSQPDPGLVGLDEEAGARRWLRRLLVAEVLLELGSFVMVLHPSTAGLVAGGLTPAGGGTPWALVIPLVAFRLLAPTATLARFIVSLMYVQRLARRVPDPALMAEASRNLWLMPLVYVVGYVMCGLGPLVAKVLYLVMLFRIRADVERVIERIGPEAPADGV